MNPKIVLFGAGAFAQRNLSVIEKYFCIEAICDNSSELYGKMFCDKYRIISFSQLKESFKKHEVLVALNDRRNYDIVSKQLEDGLISFRHVNDAVYDRCVETGEFFCLDEKNISEIDRIRSGKRNIFLLTAPAHSNMGDQAQTYCTEMILREKYNDCNLFIYDEYRIAENFFEILYIIKQNTNPNDIILLHSGYRLTNLYMLSEYITEMMGQLFADRNMIFLPQTVYFNDKVVQERLSERINDNVTIMCRDSVSLTNVSELFPKARAVLYPDLVTSLIGRYQFNNKRNGVLLCLRKTDDGESLLSEANQNALIDNIKGLGCSVSVADTTIDVDWKIIAENRKNYVEKEIELFSKFQLVITDRFHGAVFALTANTPVIVMPTKDHKVSSGLKWFEVAKFDGIYFCKDSSDVYTMAAEVISQGKELSNPSYFYDKYYKEFDLEEL